MFICVLFFYCFKNLKLGRVEAPQMFIVCIVSTCQKSQTLGALKHTKCLSLLLFRLACLMGMLLQISLSMPGAALSAG